MSRGCYAENGSVEFNLNSLILQQLHWLPAGLSSSDIQDRRPGLSVLTGQSPAYLSDDCQLPSDVRTRHSNVRRSTFQ